MTIHERIKNRRKELGMTADDVAAELGISRATVYRYESAEIMNMGIDKLIPLARVLKTTPEYLMGYSENPQSKIHHLYPADTEEEATRVALEGYLRTVGAIPPDHVLTMEEALRYQEELGWPLKKEEPQDVVEIIRGHLEVLLEKPVTRDQAESFIAAYKRIANTSEGI